MNKKDFTYYNSKTKKWEIEHGKYKILVGSSSRDIKLQTEIEIKSKDLEIERKYPEVYKSGDVQNITAEAIKKFYQKKNSQYKKDMVDELIKIAKENNSNTECEFLKIYLT